VREMSRDGSLMNWVIQDDLRGEKSDLDAGREIST
jgi:hypothetical protein